MQYFTPCYGKQILLINHLKYIMQIQTEKNIICELGNPDLYGNLTLALKVKPLNLCRIFKAK